MITTKELNRLRSELAIIGTGAKRDLAIALDVKPSVITKYLKYGDIPKERLNQINKFLKTRK